MNTRYFQLAPTAFALALAITNPTTHAAAAKEESPESLGDQSCTEVDIRCAKTVSAAVSSSGRIWFVWSVEDILYVNHSDDLGKRFSAPIRVTSVPERISTNSESPPQIALDAKGNIYTTWIKQLPAKFTSEVRFSHSTDSGNTFSGPVSVNDDGPPTGRSFNQLRVDANGQIYIVWMDGRRAVEAEAAGKEFAGTSLFFATANPSRGEVDFVNSHLADRSCECCRLGLDFSPDGDILNMGRLIYGDDIRDHGLLAINKSGKLLSNRRISYENWELNGCPHHGGSLVTQDERTHMTWFSNAPDAGGLFYAYTDDQGVSVSDAINFAAREAVPSRPYITRSTTNGLDLIWREFDGKNYRIKHMHSDAGTVWSEPTTIDESDLANDYPLIVNHPGSNLLLWHKPGQTLVLRKI